MMSYTGHHWCSWTAPRWWVLLQGWGWEMTLGWQESEGLAIAMEEWVGMGEAERGEAYRSGGIRTDRALIKGQWEENLARIMSSSESAWGSLEGRLGPGCENLWMPGLGSHGRESMALLLFKPGFIHSFFQEDLNWNASAGNTVGNMKTSPYPCWTYILLDLSPNFVIYILGKHQEIPKPFQVSVHLWREECVVLSCSFISDCLQPPGLWLARPSLNEITWKQKNSCVSKWCSLLFPLSPCHFCFLMFFH